MKQKQQKQIAIILVPVLILTIIWVISNIYHSHTASTITDPLSYQIIPIQGKFDQETITQVTERNRIDPTNEIAPGTSITPSPTIEDEDEIDSSPSASTQSNEEENEDEDENL